MKWITAKQLEDWAGTQASKGDLPALIADLIRASATDIQAFRFPNGEKGQVRGFDGFLKAKGVPPFVPDGDSIWEFGTDKDYQKKANQDCQKRTKDVDQAGREHTTLVLVNPRPWNNPKLKIEDWLAEKRKQKQWKGIEFLDGIKLEAWLDDHPAVAAKYARYKLGLMPQTDAYSTDEFWDDYSLRFSPKLTEAVVLAGRKAQAEEFLLSLKVKGDRLAYAADSEDEVIAFAVAAMRLADPETRKFFECRTLIVNTEEAAKQLINQQDLIFLPRQQALNVVGRLKTAGPTVVSECAYNVGSKREVLQRPTSFQLASALVSSMGYPEEKAYEMARQCGRSLSVLARQIPSGKATPPTWLNSQEVIPALLAGAWDSSSQADKAVLAALGGFGAYEEVEAPLRSFIVCGDPPIDRVDTVWSMRASVDAFLHLGHHLGEEHFKRFAEQARVVFSPPPVKPPKADDVLDPSSIQKKQHSEWLREGMMTTLLQIAALHEEARLVIPGYSPQAFVDEIVRNIPNLSSDYRLLASLKAQLPLLAESAPVPFLEALDRLIEGDRENLIPLFSQNDNTYCSTSGHLGVLWALEVLAWNPLHLLEATLCLAKLAAVDPGGNLDNRPINSLRDIFLPWSPHTNAPHEQRIGVLSNILGAVPTIAWPLLNLLLPGNTDSVTSTQKPKFAEAAPGGDEKLTCGIVWKTQGAIVDLAVKHAGLLPERWKDLIGVLHQCQPSTFNELASALEKCFKQQKPKARLETMKALQKAVNRHRTYARTDWALKGEPLDRLLALVRKFKTNDQLKDNLWLFDKDVLPTEEIQGLRVEALQSILATGGIRAIANMAAKVQLAMELTEPLDRLSLSENHLLELIGLLLRKKPTQILATALARVGAKRYDDSWIAHIRQLAVERSLSPKEIAALFLHFQDEKTTWDRVASFGDEVDRHYWQQKKTIGFHGTAQDLAYAIKRYLALKCPLAALEATYPRSQDLPFSLLIEVLEASIPAINAEDSNVTSMTQHYIEHLFDVLEKRKDIDPQDLARIEFQYLPFLQHRHQPLTLHKVVLDSPEDFVFVLSKAYKPASGEAPPLSESDKRLSQAAYRLLQQLKHLPGQTENQLNFDKLSTWCDEVRKHASKVDRREIADSRIGHLLAHAPVAPEDHAWPHRAVRQLLEHLSSDAIEEAIAIERFNMRGLTARTMGEGGQQERDLATQATEWAKAMPRFPRTAAMLTRIATMWTLEGEARDIRVAQEELRG